MSQSSRIDFDLPADRAGLRAAGEDKQGIRLGLALAGGGLGAAVGLIAAFSAGIPTDNPVGWLAVASAAAIGAVLGA